MDKPILFDIQLFAEEATEETTEVTEVETTEEIPSEEVETEETEQTEEETEEYDEILYNKEPIKIPKSQRQEYLQKGYNYDKVHGKLSEYEKKIQHISKLTGMEVDQVIENLENQKLEQEAQEYAIQNGLTEEQAKEKLQDNKKTRELEKKLNMIEYRSQIDKQKEPLKDKAYYKELEPEIDKLVDESIESGDPVNVEAAYRYLIGTNIEKLQEKTQKSTIANIQDRAKRGLVDAGDTGVETNMPQVNSEMAKVFGNDPSEIAKYVKQNSRR